MRVPARPVCMPVGDLLPGPGANPGDLDVEHEVAARLFALCALEQATKSRRKYVV